MTRIAASLLGAIRCAAVLGALCAAAAADACAQPIESGELLRGRFAQDRVLQGFQAPLRSDGSFLLQPGRGLIWRTERPFAVVTVVTPTGLVQQSGGSETMRLPAARMPAMARLFALLDAALAGNWAATGQQFAIARGGDATRWEVQLTPLPDAAFDALALKEVRMRGSRFVESVEIVKKSGDSDRLVFTDHELSRSAPSAEEARLLEDAVQP